MSVIPSMRLVALYIETSILQYKLIFSKAPAQVTPFMVQYFPSYFLSFLVARFILAP